MRVKRIGWAGTRTSEYPAMVAFLQSVLVPWSASWSTISPARCGSWRRPGSSSWAGRWTSAAADGATFAPRTATSMSSPAGRTAVLSPGRRLTLGPDWSVCGPWSDGWCGTTTDGSGYVTCGPEPLLTDGCIQPNVAAHICGRRTGQAHSGVRSRTQRDGLVKFKSRPLSLLAASAYHRIDSIVQPPDRLTGRRMPPCPRHQALQAPRTA